MNELSVIVKRFGEEQNQTDEEINCVLDTLNDNWLTNLSQYFEMSSLQRSKVKFNSSSLPTNKNFKKKLVGTSSVIRTRI